MVGTGGCGMAVPVGGGVVPVALGFEVVWPVAVDAKRKRVRVRERPNRLGLTATMLVFFCCCLLLFG